MPDWDVNSPRLASNLKALIELIAHRAGLREAVSVEEARQWQRSMMEGLVVVDARYVGAYRGEAGLEDVEVKVAGSFGVPAANVAEELAVFEGKLRGLVSTLDSLVPAGAEPNADQLSAIIDVCGWAHAEWVRIHPFANGNGRTARLWANSIAMRYGLPPFIRLRPRPGSGYGDAGANAMRGDWKPTVIVLRQFFNDFLDPTPGR